MILCEIRIDTMERARVPILPGEARAYGLFRALRAYKIYLVGAPNLQVKVDAKYIKGMLNNPDIQLNAAINRWIAAILLFDFELVHVPADRHAGADGLSRRPRADEDEEEKGDPEDWIDQACGLSLEIVHWDRLAFTRVHHPCVSSYLGATNSHQPQLQPYRLALTEDETPRQIPRSDRMRRRDDELNDM